MSRQNISGHTPSDWQICPIAPSEAGAVTVLHRQCFPGDGWTEDDFKGILNMAGAHGWWAIDPRTSQRAGFLFELALPPSCEIITLGVIPTARRQRVARMLLADLCVRAAMAGIDAITLEVAEDNNAALKLYESLSFKAVGRRVAYYRRPNGDTSDARVLRRAVRLNSP